MQKVFRTFFFAIIFVVVLQIAVVILRVYHSHEKEMVDRLNFMEHERMKSPSHQLPSIALDRSEIVFSSTIERASKSSQLFITSIFMASAMMDPNEVRQSKISRFRKEMKPVLEEIVQKQKSIHYLSNGRRNPETKYFCRVRCISCEFVNISASFLPNRQSLDANSNRRYDVMRCPIPTSLSFSIHMNSNSKENQLVDVELWRERTLLVNFQIPWKLRRLGYLLSPSPLHSSSRLDVWKEYETYAANIQPLAPDTRKPDVIHICTARHKNTHHDRSIIYRYLEFVQHHILLGVSHIYLSVEYSWGSYSMGYLLDTLKVFIDEGQVSVVSEAYDEINQVSSTFGIQWDYVALRNLQATSCLYLSKGVADYVAVWNVNEFFLPRPPHSSILSVIQSISSSRPLYPADLPPSITSTNDWKGGPGWADGDAHPYCYLSVRSFPSLPAPATASASAVESSASNPWLAAAYDTSPILDQFEIKSIFPTRTMTQAGVHMGGGCRLDAEWTGCQANSSECFAPVSDHLYLNYQITIKPHISTTPSIQKFDDFVTERDAKLVDPATVGKLVRFTPLDEARAQRLPTIKQDTAVLSDNANEYVSRFSGGVMRALSLAGFNLKSLQPLPPEEAPSFDEKYWQSFAEAFPPEIRTEEVSHNGMKVNNAFSPPFNSSDIFQGNENGYFNFTQSFTRDVLRSPPSDSLPAFANDNSDVALAAIIERQHDSWNLFITTFFLQHWMLWRPPTGYGFLRVSDFTRKRWKQAGRLFNQTQYRASGAREGVEYYCRIAVHSEASKILVKGIFLPNALSTDVNGNRRLDIMRCLLPQSKDLYRNMTTSQESVHVEIMRGGVVLFTYSIPWRTRRVGYSLSSPPHADSFLAWKGYDPRQLRSVPGSSGGSTLHMCVAGVESPLSQDTVARYAEFIQHHYLMGVEHMFLSTAYAWNGLNMARFLTAFRSYLSAGQMTVSTLAGDNIDLLYSFLGASVDRDSMKVFNVNMCLYLSKGVADYVAVWDTDEFFIPRPPHHTIIDVIRSADSPIPLSYGNSSRNNVPSWSGGRGWADGKQHPFCNLILSSEAILSPRDGAISQHPWIGMKYTLPPEINYTGFNFQKSIFPTRRIFQAGLHVAGACHLEGGWGGCTNTSDFCYRGANADSNFHSFNSLVRNENAKTLDPTHSAVLYHIQMYRPHELSRYTSREVNTTNEYVSQHFTRVIHELKKRGLYVLATLPTSAIGVNSPDEEWVKLYPSTQHFVVNREADIETIPMPPDSFYGKPNELPHFVKDCTDVILGAIIERKYNSWDLHIDTFFLANEQYANFTRKIYNKSLKKESLGPWMRITNHSLTVPYTEYGVRNDGYKYYCSLTNFEGGTTYRVRGVFMPNQLTPDANANQRLDILRCPIFNSMSAYRNLTRSGEHLQVEVLRDEYSLVRYRVPWKTRRVGYMLTPTLTRLDPWKGFQAVSSKPSPSLPVPLPGKIGGDSLHMCVPGIESALSKRRIALYAEFMQHHFSLGVEHMYVATTYTWGGTNMAIFQEAFRSYIDDGMMSLSTAATDADLIYGLFGVSMFRDNVKIFFVNMCLYYAKGVADYVAVWDVDEYFIPHLPHFTIMDVIRSADTSEPLEPISLAGDVRAMKQAWQGGRGWADGEAHPLCYLMMSSQVLYRPAGDLQSPLSATDIWIGSQFTVAPEKASHLKFKKPIIPTRKIFQGALHMVGGCRLEPPFTGCNTTDEFCLSQNNRHRYGTTALLGENGQPINAVDFSHTQRFDGLIMDKDAKKINMETEAVIYHIQVHRSYLISSSPVNSTNDYVSRFFKKVLQQLRSRGIELLVTMPSKVAPMYVGPDEGWIPIQLVFNEP